jgi:hypothetical protein
MPFKQLMIAVAMATTAVAGLPAEAEAQGRHGWHGHHKGHGWKHHKKRHYYRGYHASRGYYDYGPRRYRCRSSGGTTGLIIGGAAGALLGREIDTYGDRAPGTILGGAAGALLGREIARKDRC